MGTANTKAKAREAQFDAAVEAALLDPTSIVDVPEPLQTAMQDEGLEPIAHIRFTKLTPRRQGQITDAVMRKYHKDLQDPDLLSDERIMELAVAKGAWTAADDARITDLQESTTGQMATLYQEGAVRSLEWSSELDEKAARFVSLATESDELTPELKDTLGMRFKRWLLYTPAKKAQYTTEFAASLGVDEYNPDKDLTWLLENAPTLEGLSLLEEIQELQDKIEQYLELRGKRLELDLLLRRRTEIFSNSVESRQRNAGQMARLFFTSERVVDGRPSGSLRASLDELYDLPPELIKWLIEEQFFFHNNIPRAARDYLSEFGFQTVERTAAEAQTDTSDGSTAPSGESPVPPKRSSDSPPAEPTDADSSASAAGMS